MNPWLRIGRRLFVVILGIGLGMTIAGAAEGTTVLYVAPDGRDTHPGSSARPFASLERARDEVRRRRTLGDLPPGPVEIRIRSGEYRARASFRLEAEDSGTAAHPVIYTAEEPGKVRFTGAVTLRSFAPVKDEAVRERLPEPAREQVVETDLNDAGVTEVPPFVRGGFSSGRGFRTHPAVDLYVDGKPMTLARWPNEGFVETGEVPGPLTLTAWDRKPGSPEGRFRFDGDRPLRWMGEPEAWLYGYWFWSWADSYEKIAAIDPERREIRLEQPWHGYGYRQGQRYFALNLLSELDAPGEWYLDRARHRLLLYPAGRLARDAVTLALLPAPLVVIDGAAHLHFRGLTWEGGAADGLVVTGGESIRIEGCTLRRMSGNGIEIRGGRNHQVLSCDLHTLGRGGIVLTGGNRRTLERSGHVVDNCHIHHLSRIDHTYTPGLLLDGVGHQVRHCLIHHVASSAFRVEGNDHLIELNEAHRVVLESDDQGAVDMFGNPTYRGNVYRHNYWHHLGNWDARDRQDDAHTQRAGIRLDDAICGTVVEGNIFQRCTTGKTHFGGVQIHGGKENLVVGNLFVDCGAAVSFTPWGAKRWEEFVKDALAAPAVDRELYLARYPTLAALAQNPDRNRVVSNVVVRCGTTLLRAPAFTETAGNRESSDEAIFREDSSGRLEWSPAVAAAHGLDAIPFARMGLRADAWRRHSGTEWTLNGDAP